MKVFIKLLSIIFSISLAVSLCACGESYDSKSNNKTDSHKTTSVVSETGISKVSSTQEPATETTTEDVIPEYQENVYNVYAFLKENIKEIGQYIEFTAETDQNKNLGKEGYYTQKLNFSFTDLKQNLLLYPTLGASIEIFSDEANSKEYEKNIKDDSYKTFRCGNIVLRISKEVDSALADSIYEKLKEFMTAPKDYSDIKEKNKNNEVHPFSESDNYKAACKETAYKDIARDSNGLIGDYVKFTGEVIQVMEEQKTYRMNVTADDYGFYTDTIMFTYNKASDEDRILEKDIITIWGQSTGLVTYDTVLGDRITVPCVDVKYVEIN